MIRMQRFACNLLAAILLLAAPPALAGSCWIATVKQTGPSRVEISFIDAREVLLSHDGSHVDYLVSKQPAQSHGTSELIVVEALSAELGDTFSTRNTPEDTCTAMIVMQDGRLGISTHSAFHPPAFFQGQQPGGESTDFTPAE